LHAHPHLLGRVGLAAEAVDLRPTGDAGLDAMAAEIAVDDLGILLVMGDRMRAGPDQRHVSPEHIEELRQLVEAGPPEQPADPGHPWIVAPGLRHRRIGTPIMVHGPEFEDRDLVVVESVALLAKQHGATAVELDERRHRRHHRQRDGENERAEHAVLEPLPEAAPTAERTLEDMQQRQAGEGGEAAHSLVLIGTGRSFASTSSISSGERSTMARTISSMRSRRVSATRSSTLPRIGQPSISA